MISNTKHLNWGSNNWVTTTERFVAFIDIMGFKDMVLKKTHKELYRMMKSINEAKTLNENIFESKENLKLVKSTTYSDSIMLYSKDKTIASFDSLVATVSGLTNDLFIQGIPHKGSVAFGVMTLDTKRSIFFGQPLIDAYLLQEELHFYGIILHGSIEKKVAEKIDTTAFVKKYDCFLKSGRSSHYTIYPMHIDSASAKQYPELNQKLSESLRIMRYDTSGQLRRYIDNTESYFKYIGGLL